MDRGSRSFGLFANDGLSADALRILATIASVAGAITLAIGVAGVAGWIFDIPILRHFINGFPAIRPLSAVCLGLLGGALWVSPSRPALSATLATLAAATGSLSLFGSMSDTEVFLRQLIVSNQLLGADAPEIAERLGVTTPLAALGYVCLAFALLLGRYPELVSAAQTLAISVMFTALVPVLGFVYRIDSLSSPLLSSTPSLHGSVGIALLAVGILCTYPERGAIGLLAGNSAASRAARRILLFAFGVPVVFGGLFVYARQIGSLDVDAAVPVFVCALAATLCGSVLLVARADARMEILHRRGEQQLKSAADASPLIMWMADERGNGTHANAALLDFVGFTPEQVLGDGWTKYTHPDDVSVVQGEIAMAFAAKRPFSVELRVRHTDGSWRWVLSTGMPRFTPTHELSGYTGTWVDVTARKDAEEALHRFAARLEQRVAERTAALTESKEELARQTFLLESIVKSMGDGVLAMATDGEILLSNDAAIRLFGASTADAHTNARLTEFGFFLADGVTPFPTEQMPMIRALSGENVDNVMMVARHVTAPEGLYVRITGRAIRDRDGEIIGSIIVGRDVTEFEHALEATRRLAAVVESSGDAILSVSLDGVISTWNRGAERMYGYSADEAIGSPLARVDPSTGTQGIATMIENLKQGALVIRRDAVGRRRDGTPVDIAATMSPIHDEAGHVHAISVVHHDVTHLKAAERRIQALNDELEERVRDRTAALIAANHDLENYASSVAHDLRTPLRAIAGFARVLEEDYAEIVGQEGQRVIGVVRKNAQDMGQFIDALLSFSAVDRQPPNKIKVDVSEVVRECLDSLGADCADREIAFHVGDLPPCRADRASLKQVFLNLLANAVKFTRRVDNARIDVGSRIEPGGATSYFVRDNGVGFDMSNTRRLFGIFQRLHAPADFEGTGLGLANVARIVAAHGGRVWAEAEPGKGAMFQFIIEQQREEQQREQLHEGES
ncbi:MAG TPA: PAS domain S-box protein [Candidatus Limnocylindrales bacterium]|nr:PAS domain S-box protein [Candidatus Limnocylindrales bacterium]